MQEPLPKQVYAKLIYKNGDELWLPVYPNEGKLPWVN